MDGTAAVGTTTKYAREDHRHPTDTSRAASTHTHAQADVTNLVTDLGLKAPLAGPVFTGDARAVTPATADNDTSIATTAFVKAQGYAPLASPTFTGDARAVTPTAGDNDTSIATTAFVTAAVAGVGTGVMTQTVITSSGTYTKPAGLKYLEVWVVGGGGGSFNGGGTGPGTCSISGGAGGGGAACKLFAAASLGATVAMTVGAGGWGTAGGTTSFGTVSAYGGTEGALYSGGGFGPLPGYAGFGGGAAGGDINSAGGDGGLPTVCPHGTNTGTGWGGDGGGSHFAGARAGPLAYQGQAYNGNSGYVPGGGASGGATGENIGFATTGGTGGAGIIYLREFF